MHLPETEFRMERNRSTRVPGHRLVITHHSQVTIRLGLSLAILSRITKTTDC